MSQEIRERQVGDTLRTISAYMQYRNAQGILTTDDLTGETITFTMVNAADGTTKVDAQSATGSTGGLVTYQPVAGDVDTVGIYHGFFTHTSGGATDTFPARTKDLRIEISSKTQTAQEAYDAAIA